MPKDFTTDIISLKHINASKYKSRSSQKENTKEEKKKKRKKQKYQLKYIFVEMMNKAIFTNKIALNAVTGASRKIIIEQNCNGARVSVINFHIRLPLIDCSV